MDFMRTCPSCKKIMNDDCFRKNHKYCVWCVFEDKEKRAKARYLDKKKSSKLNISKNDFVEWYISQDDSCSYCGLTFQNLKDLKIKRGGGYVVGWDIDRIDSRLPYEKDNLALSCFICNMAKGDILSYEEAKIIGQAVKKVWHERIKKNGEKTDE